MSQSYTNQTIRFGVGQIEHHRYLIETQLVFAMKLLTYYSFGIKQQSLAHSRINLNWCCTNTQKKPRHIRKMIFFYLINFALITQCTHIILRNNYSMNTNEHNGKN